MRSILRGMTVFIAAGGLVALTLAPASAADTAAVSTQAVQQTVTVVGDGNSVRLSDNSVFAGSIRFRVSTTNAQTGSAVTLFRLKPGKTLADFFTGLRHEFSLNPRTAAQGTRELRAAAFFRGLADVVVGHPEVVTESLSAGTYFAMDLANVQSLRTQPQLATLHVRAGGNVKQRSDLRNQVHVVATPANRFRAPDAWPHRGTYQFENEASTIHFMNIVPVKAGVTDADIQRFFDAIVQGKNPGPQPFRPGPSGGNDVVSPEFELQVTYDLPPGRYALFCFVADETTGLPHAFMGMHKVIVLR